MKNFSLFLVLIGCLFSFVSCDNKDHLSENPISCGCSQMVDCEIDCACSCQK